MAGIEPTSAGFRFDAFISYSRKDADFARRLEQALRGYRPPKDLGVPQRLLRVFRDEADFTGSEYHTALDRNLKDAAKLIVICSPHAAASEYVGDEIRRFAEHRGKDHVVSILLDGIPNNEVRDEEAGRRAFPEALVRLLPIPLAADYRGFDARRDRIAKGRFAPAWFKTLADVYADYGVDREKVEQRQRRRQAQRRRSIATISSAVVVALVGLAIWALISRRRADVQGDLSEARRLAVQSRLAFDDTSEGLLNAALLAAASLRSTWTIDGQIELTKCLALLPRPPVWRRGGGDAVPSGIESARRAALAWSPDGSRIAMTTRSRRAIQLLDAGTGRPVTALGGDLGGADRTVLAFSPDGRTLIMGCGHEACVIDQATGHTVARLPQGTMVWSASFSPDGRLLATAAYGSSDALIYDIPSWRLRVKIKRNANVFAVAFSPAGDFIATADPRSLGLWRVGSYAAPVAEGMMHGLPWAVAFSQFGSSLVVGSGGITEWNIAEDDGAVTLEASAAKGKIPAHAVLPVPRENDYCFAAASSSATHLLCGPSLTETLRIPVSASAIAVAPDGSAVATVDTDGMLARWPLQSGGDVARLALGSSVESLAAPPGKDWIAAGSESGVVAIVDTTTWTERRRFALPAAIAAIEPSPDGARLAVSAGRALHVIDTKAWREQYRLSYESKVGRATFAPAGGVLLVVRDNQVVLVSADDGRQRPPIVHLGEVKSVSFSPDGASLATVSALPWAHGGGHGRFPTRTRVLDVETAKDVGWLDEGQFGELDPERSSALERLHEWGDTEAVRASHEWGLASRESDRAARGHGRWTATPDSSAVDLEYVAGHRAVATYRHEGEVTAAQMLPASAPRWLVTAGKDGLLRVWPIGAEELRSEACRRLRGILSEEAMTKRLGELGVSDPCPPPHQPRD